MHKERNGLCQCIAGCQQFTTRVVGMWLGSEGRCVRLSGFRDLHTMERRVPIPYPVDQAVVAYTHTSAKYNHCTCAWCNSKQWQWPPWAVDSLLELGVYRCVDPHCTSFSYSRSEPSDSCAALDTTRRELGRRYSHYLLCKWRVVT